MTPRRRRKAHQANWAPVYGAATAGPARAGETVVPPSSVPVTAIILACDEQPNIERAVRSVGWCRQVVVVDSGSTDRTREIAGAAGAAVWEEPWRGFAAQREWAMRHHRVDHDWVFFLDADEWVPTDLAEEIARRVGREECAAFALRFRLVFLDHWIAHCGWYTNSWQVRLMDRRKATFTSAEEYGERAGIDGPIRRLAADFVDEDAKGLGDWLRKHVRYAELEARRRTRATAPVRQLRKALVSGGSARPLARTVAKEVVFPLVPAKPLAIFVYMYLVRGGWRDGRVGLVFCLYHAWYQLTVGMLQRSAGPAASSSEPGQRPTSPVVPASRRPADDQVVAHVGNHRR